MKKNGQPTLSQASDGEVWNHPEPAFSPSPLLQRFLRGHRDKRPRPAGLLVREAAVFVEESERMEAKEEK